MSAARPIRIGMTSNVLGLGSTALAAAHIARAQGHEFFFFRPEDISPSGETIAGMFFHNGRWERRRTPFPDVVENHLTEAITSEGWEAVVQRCRITTPYLGGKLAVDRVMRASGGFDQLLIPTVRAESPEQVVEEIARLQRVVIKPEFGTQGRGIVYAAQSEAGFAVNAAGTDHQFALPQFKAFLARTLDDESHLVQQYVASRTALGQPFDIRIHVRRDGNAVWQHIYSNARIGSGDGIAANLSLGGALAEIGPFLKHRFGETAGKVHKRLMDITRNFPPAFQALFPGRVIPALGIDVGIDEQGQPRLFEVNSNPGPQFAPFVDHMWRFAYAIYLVKNPAALDGVVRGDRTKNE